MKQVDIDSFEGDARRWGRDFYKFYHDRNVTPFIHAMANHVGEFLTLHGSLLPFTQQGLEKYNDITTKHYFRSTNHKGTQAFTQKQNRIEHLHDSGLYTQKKTVKCGNCQQEGHSIRTLRYCSLAVLAQLLHPHIMQLSLMPFLHAFKLGNRYGK